MPTYHEIMTTDLSALTAAAKSWDGMAGEFAKQEKAYERDVHGISMGTTWTGLSAEAADARFDITLKQIQYAHRPRPRPSPVCCEMPTPSSSSCAAG
ncbi:hypothetical protein ABT382_20530 [Streptomyces pharetrae]|uniref:hypothetical protein n=1 Tax=Streptomyces pharetrae TaxID=291370 RepID=UPI003352D9FD